ncbi:MAG: hypothetical protein FWF12_04075 [Betaproteobacteria bacterium]|nr:hypothetical protein [Betaproteobacteria bacterium]
MNRQGRDADHTREKRPPKGFALLVLLPLLLQIGDDARRVEIERDGDAEGDIWRHGAGAVAHDDNASAADLKDF